MESEEVRGLGAHRCRPIRGRQLRGCGRHPHLGRRPRAKRPPVRAMRAAAFTLLRLIWLQLRKALKRIGVVMTQEEVVYLMGMVDTDGDGSVTYEEFVKFVLEYQIE